MNFQDQRVRVKVTALHNISSSKSL